MTTVKPEHETEALWITFHGAPPEISNDGAEFVAIENDRGQSRSAGKWCDNGDGYWTLGPFVTVDDHKRAIAAAEERGGAGRWIAGATFAHNWSTCDVGWDVCNCQIGRALRRHIRESKGRNP